MEVITKLGSTCTSALTALLVRREESRPLIRYFGENNVVGLIIPVVVTALRTVCTVRPHVASPHHFGRLASS